MIRSIFVLMMPLAIAMTSTSVMADSFMLGDAKQGESLHKKSCVACHGSEVYTRKNHSVKNLAGLIGQVEGCNTQLKLDLKQDPINDLVKYLNDYHYKFE